MASRRQTIQVETQPARLLRTSGSMMQERRSVHPEVLPVGGTRKTDGNLPAFSSGIEEEGVTPLLLALLPTTGISALQTLPPKLSWSVSLPATEPEVQDLPQD